MDGTGALAVLLLLGIFSCVSVIYSNSKKHVKQIDCIIKLLEDFSASSRSVEK